jgi:YfiH family protein
VFRQTSRGFPHYYFEELLELPGFVHYFTCRQTGLSLKDANDPVEVASLLPMLEKHDISLNKLVLLQQIHSSKVIRLEQILETAGRPPRTVRADGVVLEQAGYFAAVRTADCLPIWILNPGERKLCALHAGWRGIRDHIVTHGLQTLARCSNSPSADFLAVFGPAIRSCCYRVGPEVREQFAAAGHSVKDLFDGPHLDLAAAAAAELKRSGVLQVLDSGVCTGCRVREFFSYRRAGDADRILAIAGFRNMDASDSSPKKPGPG